MLSHSGKLDSWLTCCTSFMKKQARIQGGARSGAHPWDGGTRAERASSQGQKEGTLVSLEWLFNTIQA